MCALNMCTNLCVYDGWFGFVWFVCLYVRYVLHNEYLCYVWKKLKWQKNNEKLNAKMCIIGSMFGEWRKETLQHKYSTEKKE